MSKFRKNVAVLIFCLLAFSLFAENYTVQKGDTYYSISKKYNISLQELYSTNGIDENDVLKVGQVLKIPGKSTAENTSEKSTTTVSTAKTSNYEVVAGDTLYSISKKFGTTVDNLRSLNGLTESSVLKIGQVLKVPTTEKVVTTTGSSSAGSTKTEIKQNASVTPAAPLEDVRTYDTNKKGNVNLVWPVKALDVTYVSGKISGVAIETERNATVSCIKAGKVIFVGPYRGFGQVVFVQSDSGYIYVYSGLDKITVSNGDKVGFKTKLGIAGIDALTGNPQIILMVYLNGKVQDPALVPRDK